MQKCLSLFLFCLCTITTYAQQKDSIIIYNQNTMDDFIKSYLIPSCKNIQALKSIKVSNIKIKKDIKVIKSISKVLKNYAYLTLEDLMYYLKKDDLDVVLVKSSSELDLNLKDYNLEINTGGHYFYSIYQNKIGQFLFSISMRQSNVKCCCYSCGCETKGNVSIFDWYYFKKYLIKHLSKKISIQEESQPILMVNFYFTLL